MPPKKAKKKKAKAEGNTEGNDLQRRLEEAEAQLREEAKLIERLTRENQLKNEHIQSMEVAMTNELEKHEAIVQVLKDKEQAQRQEAEHSIEILNSKICELQVRMESCSTLDSVNASLRLRVDELMRQLEAENKSHIDEIHSMRLDMFNHKMALEQTFRKSLQELDAQYLKKAFNAMAEESKVALVANAKLKDELQMQSIGVENLMHRFKTQADQYHKMKVENEILEKGSSLRLKEISSLKTAQHEMERRMNDIKSEAMAREKELVESSTKAIEDLKQENKNLRSLYEQAHKRCQKWKCRYVTLAATGQVNKQSNVDPIESPEENEATSFARKNSTGSMIDLISTPTKKRPSITGDLVSPPSSDPREMWSASFSGNSELTRCTSAPLAASRYEVEMPLKNVRPPHTSATLASKLLRSSTSKSTKRLGIGDSSCL